MTPCFGLPLVTLKFSRREEQYRINLSSLAITCVSVKEIVFFEEVWSLARLETFAYVVPTRFPEVFAPNSFHSATRLPSKIFGLCLDTLPLHHPLAAAGRFPQQGRWQTVAREENRSTPWRPSLLLGSTNRLVD